MASNQLAIAVLSLTLAAFVGRSATSIAHESGDDPPHVAVSGEGKVSAPPDTATIRTAVVSEAASASEALAANNDSMNKLLAVLEDQGVESKDVHTSRFQVQPVYKRDDRGRTLPEVVAYRVTNQVRVHIRSLADLGKILDALVQARSNDLSGIEFGLENKKPLLEEARRKAFADAQGRATLYADAAGLKLGSLISIDEQSSAVPAPRRLELQSLAASRSAEVPIASGELEVRVGIQVKYRLVGPKLEPTQPSPPGRD